MKSIKVCSIEYRKPFRTNGWVLEKAPHCVQNLNKTCFQRSATLQSNSL